LGYNPRYVDSLSMSAVTGLFIEECGHIVDEHLWRWLGMDKQDANRAADLCLFPMIREMGCEIPLELYDPKVHDPMCKGKSMEYIYSQIHKKGQEGGGGRPGNDQNQGGNGPKEAKPGSNGQDEGKDRDKPDKAPGGLPNGRSEIREPPKDQAVELKAKWEEIIVQAAMTARAAGNLPAGLEKIVDKITHPRVNWRIQMRKFMQSIAKNDYSWRMPNKKFVPSGLYLPSLRSEAMGKVVFLWDTSGSRDYADARAECAAEFGSIHIELKPEMTYVAYFDTQVYLGGEFGPDDEIEWKPVGGGGTSFKCLFPYIEDQGIEPACVVILTDGLGPFPDKAPDVPVLWAMTTDVKPPFGEFVRL